MRHLTGVDGGERKERTGEADDDETAEYQLVHCCCVEYILSLSTPGTMNSCLTIASAPSFTRYIAAHDLINIIMPLPLPPHPRQKKKIIKKNPMNLLPIDSKWKPLCIDVIFQGNSSRTINLLSYSLVYKMDIISNQAQ